MQDKKNLENLTIVLLNSEKLAKERGYLIVVKECKEIKFTHANRNYLYCTKENNIVTELELTEFNKLEVKKDNVRTKFDFDFGNKVIETNNKYKK